jgi:hypothetical protein
VVGYAPNSVKVFLGNSFFLNKDQYGFLLESIWYKFSSSTYIPSIQEVGDFLPLKFIILTSIPWRGL